MLFASGAHTLFSQSDPCSLTVTRTIANGQTVDLSTWFPSTSSTTNEVIDIGVGSTLIIDKSFTFNYCTFRCANNALILTEAPSSGERILALMFSNLLSCNTSTMWQGITVVNGTRIRSYSTTIRDANWAINFPGGYDNTRNELYFTRFINDRIGIQIGSLFEPEANVGFQVSRGNSFTSSGTLNNTTTSLFPQAGIQVDNAILLFGTVGSRNVFNGLYTGISMRRSYAQIANCDFTDMLYPGVQISPAPPNRGTGIFMRNSNLAVTRVASSGNCRFQGNLSYGIYSSNHNGQTRIERAVFGEAQRFGIFIDQSLTPTPFLIQDNTFNLNHPRSRSAIFFQRPPGTSSVTDSYIRRNQINMPVRETPAAQLGSIVEVTGIAGATNMLEISRNRILYTDWPTQEKYGIHLTGAGDNNIVKQNRITYTRTGSIMPWVDLGGLGIVFDGMTGFGNEISQDTIRSILTSQSSDVSLNDRSMLKCGIHVINSNAPTICANDIDSTYRGIHMGGRNLGTVLGLNQVRRHVFGMHFRKNNSAHADTDISNQIHCGNTWSTNSSDYINGGVGAMYDAIDNAGTPLFIFRYDSDITGGLPPSATPAVNTWFFQEDNALDACIRAPNLFEDEEIEIAEGEYPYNTPAEDWDQQRHLWNKLLRNPGIEEGITEVETFMGDPKGNPTSPYLFAKALYGYEKAFHPDSAWQIKWDATLYNLSSKQGRIVGLLNTMGLDTLNIDPSDADSLAENWTQLGLYQDTLRVLADTFAARRDVKLLALSDEVNMLPGSTDWEKAWVKILSAAIIKGQGLEIDSLGREELLEIANMCPTDVGLASTAVIAYLDPEDADPFKGCEKNAAACAEERHQHVSEVVPATLFPNPVNKRLSVLLPEGDMGGTWKIRSASGQLVTQGNWNTGETQISIDVSACHNGLYFFEAEWMNGQRTVKKFTVIK